MPTERLQRVCALMQEQEIQAVAINAGADLKYFHQPGFSSIRKTGYFTY